MWLWKVGVPERIETAIIAKLVTDEKKRTMLYERTATLTRADTQVETATVLLDAVQRLDAAKARAAACSTPRGPQELRGCTPPRGRVRTQPHAAHAAAGRERCSVTLPRTDAPPRCGAPCVHRPRACA